MILHQGTDHFKIYYVMLIKIKYMEQINNMPNLLVDNIKLPNFCKTVHIKANNITTSKNVQLINIALTYKHCKALNVSITLLKTHSKSCHFQAHISH